MKRIIALFLALFFSISFALNNYIIYAAGNDAPTQLWITPSETNGIPARIDAFKANIGTSTRPNYVYQIFLPGNADLNSVFISWDSDLQATVDGVSYSSGACPIPVLETQKTYTFKNSNSTVATFNVIAYQGSQSVPAVFIEIDESEGHPTIAQMDAETDGHTIECTGQINIDGTWYELTKMKGRGNASWKESKDKKPYNITLGQKINFPGIDSAKTKKWSLLAEVLDHSLLCNRSGYHLAHELGIGQDTASADVWMNGEYQGCYTVTPKTDSFVTNDGYMIEQDNYLEDPVAEGGDPQFTLNGLKEASGWSSCYNRITVKKIGDNLLKNEAGVVDESPENMEAAAARIQSWLQDAWDAIRSDTGYNSKNKYYTEYIDVESFAKMYLMHEYVKSYDVCAGSILFHRDGQTDNYKLEAGPLWDLDNAMGSVYQNASLGKADDRRNGDRRSAVGDFIQNVTEYKTSIYKTISKHADFMEVVIRMYNKHRSDFNNLSSDVQQMITEISQSAMMNHIKVTDLGHSTGKNNHYYGSNQSFGSGQYTQNYLATTNSKTDWPNYAANLKTYITVRSLWFQNNYYDPNYVDPDTCEHQYDIVTVPATCITEGYSIYTCPICHNSYTEILPIIPHNYENGACTVCGQSLINVTITCDPGSSVTVYDTQELDSHCIEHATLVHPRNSSTGFIDCSGDAQVNFIVDLEPGYDIKTVEAIPSSSYKNLKLPADTGIANGYRLTKVNNDLSITVKTVTQITFDANGGTGTMENQEVDVNTDTVLSENLYTRTGYTFTGWNTENNGSGTAYDDAGSVSFSGPVTLYAQWEPIMYTVRFVDEDGSTLQSSQIAYDNIPVYSGPTPTKSATAQYTYTFAGWSPEVTVVIGEATYTATYRSTLNKYLVKFVNEDGTVLKSNEVEYGTTPVYDGVTPSKPATEDYYYTFTGWDKAIVPVEGNITYTAKYSSVARTYGEPVWTWESNENSYSSAKATFTTNDGQTEFSNSIDAELNILTVEPTCEVTGMDTYTATVLFRGINYTDSREIILDELGHNYTTTVITPTCEEQGYTIHICSRCGNTVIDTYVPAIGHVWGEPRYTWGNDNCTVTAKHICINDPLHTETETVNVTVVTVDPGCEITGKIIYTSDAFENAAFTVQTKETIIPPLGHSPLGPVEENRTEATCTEDGHYDLTVYCERCGAELSRETITIPATGHAWGEWAVTREATCEEAGEETRICANDNSHKETRAVNPLGHEYETTVTSPTCTEQGYTTHTCTRCGESYADTYVEATGHAYEYEEMIWSEDLTTAKGYFKCQNDEEHTMYVDAEVTIEEKEWEFIHKATVTYEGVEYTDTKTVDKVIDLTAPTMTTAKNYGSGVLVEWDEVEGATGYVVYRRAWDKKIDDWTAFARWNNTKELKFLDTKVYEGTKYQYGIKAYYGDDPKTTTKLGPVGPMSTALIYSKKPSETTKTVTANTDEGIRVSWNKVAGATGYVIYRRAWSSTTGGWTDFQRWNNTTSTEWTDTKVYAGTRYQYGIKAYYGNDPKDMRYVGAVGPLSTNVRITTRKITSVTADGNNITVKWDASKLFTGYQVEYSNNYDNFSNAEIITIDDYTVSKITIICKNVDSVSLRVRSYHIFEDVTYFGEWSKVEHLSLIP